MHKVTIAREVNHDVADVWRLGLLGWVIARLMVRPMLQRALRDLGQGVDDHLSTGAIVGKDGALVAAAA